MTIFCELFCNMIYDRDNSRENALDTDLYLNYTNIGPICHKVGALMSDDSDDYAVRMSMNAVQLNAIDIGENNRLYVIDCWHFMRIYNCSAYLGIFT